MQKLRVNYLIIFGILLGFHFLTGKARADTITFTDLSEKRTIQNVVVISQTDDRVEYLMLPKGSSLIKGILNWGKDIKVTYSSDEDKRKLLEAWIRQASSGIVTRSFGSSVKVAGFGVRYPLPENVVYIGDSPGEVNGPEFYVGKDSSDASKVLFKDIQSVDIQKNGTAARITWRNSESSEGDLLSSWKYGNRPGAPALFFGMDMETLSIIEIPLKNVRRITITGNKTMCCSGSPMHKFFEPPSTWKFCPICGKPLQTTP